MSSTYIPYRGAGKTWTRLQLLIRSLVKQMNKPKYNYLDIDLGMIRAEQRAYDRWCSQAIRGLFSPSKGIRPKHITIDDLESSLGCRPELDMINKMHSVMLKCTNMLGNRTGLADSSPVTEEDFKLYSDASTAVIEQMMLTPSETATASLEETVSSLADRCKGKVIAW